MAEKTTPKNRDEKEILGYRDALNLVHESFEYIPITPNYILQLHKIMFSHSDFSIGGQFKNVQNYISASGVERSLKKLCSTGEISMHGSGRAVFYVRESL